MDNELCKDLVMTSYLVPAMYPLRASFCSDIPKHKGLIVLSCWVQPTCQWPLPRYSICCAYGAYQCLVRRQYLSCTNMSSSKYSKKTKTKNKLERVVGCVFYYDWTEWRKIHLSVCCTRIISRPGPAQMEIGHALAKLIRFLISAANELKRRI